MAEFRKRKLPNDFYYVENAKRRRISSQEIALLSNKVYPDSFHVGQAIANGSCFFDSFRQGLEQQKGVKVTVEQLRKDCKEFAQNNPPEWFTDAIASGLYNNSYCSKTVDTDSTHIDETVDTYSTHIMDNSRWGSSYIEARILCEKYKVKLHVIERQILKKEVFFDEAIKFLSMQGHEVDVDILRRQCLNFVENDQSSEQFVEAIKNQYDASLDEYKERLERDINEKMEEDRISGRNIVEGKMLAKIYNLDNFQVVEREDGNIKYVHSFTDSSGNVPLDNPDYSDQSTIHMINKGYAHFEPLLDKKKSLVKQEQEDFQLAKQLQIDEILECCNLSKDISERAEVEKRFDELLAKNADGKISDVVGQCINDVQQRIKCLEEPVLSRRCSVEGACVEKTFHQQQVS